MHVFLDQLFYFLTDLNSLYHQQDVWKLAVLREEVTWLMTTKHSLILEECEADGDSPQQNTVVSAANVEYKVLY